MITIKEATTKKELKAFVKFPFSLYKNSKFWVPPIISEELQTFDKNINPLLLIECKSMKVTIDQHTFDQILHYNMSLNVPHLFITNGVNSYCCIIDREKEKLIFQDEIPSL